jgi:predicted lipoprotein
MLAIFRPWTVRPLQSTPSAAFDGPAYVSQAWPRVLREADATAIELAAAADPAGRASVPDTRARFVKGTGVVTAVDRQSRVGMARIRIPGRAALVSLQVGPVLRGTALRDALSFVRFTDFTNQFDYAAVGNALNDRVLQTVLPPVEVDRLTGRTVAFLGATAAPSLSEAIDVVPLRIHVEGGSR